jgi:hypothetical protein
MLLIIFVFDPLAIAMVVAANMAFAQIKDFKPKEKQKDYKVYKKSEAPKEKVIIKEVPVEKIVEIEKPQLKIPKHLKETIEKALKHARRSGKDVSKFNDRLFED